jgi:hypothetical protein
MEKRKLKIVVGASIAAVLTLLVIYMNFFRDGAESVSSEVAQRAAEVVESGLKEEPPPPPPPPVQRHGTSSRNN